MFVLRIIWDLELDGDSLFHIWHKVTVSSGENGQILKFIFSMPLLSSFVSRFKKVIYIDVQLKMPKITFQKRDIITEKEKWPAKQGHIGLKQNTPTNPNNN